MKLSTILAAIKALDDAQHALAVGESIARQVQLSSECSSASISLRMELEREFPEVKITKGE
mgnify:CR=1 FL=1